MALRGWLIDKSAYVRMQMAEVMDVDEWNARIERGLVRVSTITRLEIGFSVRTGEDGRMIFDIPPLSAMPIERLTPSMEDRAWEVQMLLADRGQHRAPSIPNLLIAAIAEKAGLTVLALDKGFDLIAEVTGQPVETLALR